MRVAIYVRKSKETDIGESIKNQIEYCRNYFANQDCSFEVFEDEGLTGGNTNRPQFQLMMKKVELKKFDIVAVYKLDRIARNTVDFVTTYHKLSSNDTMFVSATERFDTTTPMGRMMMFIIAAFADMERESIRARVTDNMYELAKMGHWSGGTPPMGYSKFRTIDNGKKVSYLEVDKSTSEIVKEIFNLYKNGYSTVQIPNIIKDKFNYDIISKTTLNLLRNPVYAPASKDVINYINNNGGSHTGETNPNLGLLRFGHRKVKENYQRVKSDNYIVATSRHTPLVDSETWINVQNLLSNNGGVAAPRISSKTFLAHKVFCGYCGKMYIISYTSNTSGRYPIFCKQCKCGRSVKLSRLEDVFLKELEATLNDSDLLEKIFSKDSRKNSTEKTINKHKKELKRIDAIIDGLVEKIALSPTSVIDILNKKLEQYIKEKYEIETKITELEINSLNNINKVNKDLVLKNGRYFLDHLSEMDIREQQRIISTIINKVEYYPNKLIQKEFVIKICV